MGMGATTSTVDDTPLFEEGVLSGGGAWLTAEDVLINAQLPGRRFELWQRNLLAGTAMLVDARGANEVVAGGGRFLAFLADGRTGVYGTLGSLPNAGVRGASREGVLAYCQSYQNGLGFVLADPNGTPPFTYLTAAAQDLQVVSPASAYWYDLLDHQVHTLGLLPIRPALRPQRTRILPASPLGARWLIYWAITDAGKDLGLVAQLDGELEGWMLETRPIAFNHDAVITPEGKLIVAWSISQGEGRGELVKVEVTRSAVTPLILPPHYGLTPVWGRLALPAPVPVPPVTPPPPPIEVPMPTPVPALPPLRSNRVWFMPNIASNILDLFQPGVDVLGNVGVFELVAQHLSSHPNVGPNTYEALVEADVFRALRAQGIALSIGMGAVKEWDPTGEKNLAELEVIQEKIAAAGGELAYLSFDEPLTSNKDFLHLPLEELARRVAPIILKAQSLGLKVAWDEAWPHIAIDEMSAFLQFLDVNHRALPNYWHLDMDHHLRTPDPAMIQEVRNVIADYAIPTAVILAGYQHPTDDAYQGDVVGWAREVKSLGLPMHHLPVMSWVEGFVQPQNFKHIEILNQVVEVFA